VWRSAAEIATSAAKNFVSLPTEDLHDALDRADFLEPMNRADFLVEMQQSRALHQQDARKAEGC
jgi:hypothetical protein